MEKAFPWLPWNTRFRRSYLCTCSIQIEKKNGDWLPQDLKVDSGSDVTMLELSHLNDLGYKKKDCRIQKYHNANAKTFLAFEHPFKIRIDDYEI